MKFENLITLIGAVSESKLTDFKYEEEGVKLELSKKEGKPTLDRPEVDMDVVTPDTPEGNLVVSPLVGTFYAAPYEDAEPFVTVGTAVKKGQTLAIVEAMKLMNDIESDYDGTITEVLVKNGQPVEYGQPLFRVK